MKNELTSKNFKLDKCYVYVDNVKYINLGTLVYNDKRYLGLRGLKTDSIRTYIEVIDDNTNSFKEVDEITQKKFNDLLEKHSDIKFNDDEVIDNEEKLEIPKIDEIIKETNAAQKKYKIKMYAIAGITVTVYAVAILNLTKIGKFNFKMYDSPSYKIASLAGDSVSKLKGLIGVEEHYSFEEQLALNSSMTAKEKELMTKFNDKLTTFFPTKDFSDFYKSISTLKMKYVDSTNDVRLANSTIAYYSAYENSIVFSERVDSNEYEKCMYHELWHAVVFHGSPKNYSSFLNEGMTEMLSRLFAGESNFDSYPFEVKLITLLLEVMDYNTMFDAFHNNNYEPLIEALIPYFDEKDDAVTYLNMIEELHRRSKTAVDDAKFDVLYNANAVVDYTYKLCTNIRRKRVTTDYYVCDNKTDEFVYSETDSKYLMNIFVDVCNELLLKDVIYVDSNLSLYISNAQMYANGINDEFNKMRILFNKVYDITSDSIDSSYDYERTVKKNPIVEASGKNNALDLFGKLDNDLITIAKRTALYKTIYNLSDGSTREVISNSPINADGVESELYTYEYKYMDKYLPKKKNLQPLISDALAQVIEQNTNIR